MDHPYPFRPLAFTVHHTPSPRPIGAAVQPPAVTSVADTLKNRRTHSANPLRVLVHASVAASGEAYKRRRRNALGHDDRVPRRQHVF